MKQVSTLWASNVFLFLSTFSIFLTRLACGLRPKLEEKTTEGDWAFLIQHNEPALPSKVPANHDTAPELATNNHNLLCSDFTSRLSLSARILRPYSDKYSPHLIVPSRFEGLGTGGKPRRPFPWLPLASRSNRLPIRCLLLLIGQQTQAPIPTQTSSCLPSKLKEGRSFATYSRDANNPD